MRRDGARHSRRRVQLPSRSCRDRAVTHFSKGPCPDGEAAGDGGLATRSWVFSKACRCDVRQARVRRAGADRRASLVWSDGGTPVDSSRAHFTRDDCTCGSRLFSVARFLKHSHLSVMSLSVVPVSRFFVLLLPLLPVLCHDTQPRQHLWLEPEVGGLECLAA